MTALTSVQKPSWIGISPDKCDGNYVKIIPNKRRGEEGNIETN